MMGNAGNGRGNAGDRGGNAGNVGNGVGMRGIWLGICGIIVIRNGKIARKHGPNRPFFLYNLSSENY